MIKSIAMAVMTAARHLKLKIAIAFIAVYAGLVASAYLFFITREADIFQVILTLALPVVTPALFFFFQAMSATYTENGLTAKALLARDLRIFWKLALITLPVVLLAWLFVYLFGEIQIDVKAAASEAVRGAQSVRQPARAASEPVDWRAAAMTAAQYLVFLFLLPLVAIHLWISTAREGLGKTVKGLGRLLTKVVSPRALITYTAGVLVFAALPYFLVFTKTPSQSPWMDLALLAARLAIAFLAALAGWVLTVGSLAELMTANEPQSANVDGARARAGPASYS